MQSLTYVIGKDKRNLVDDIQNFKIDFKDSNSNWVQARQYEDGMRQVFVTMKNEDGSPFDLTGCNYWFEGILPDGAHKILDAKHGVAIDPANGQFRFDMPKQAFAVAGSYVQAFFRIMKDGANITTLEFDLQVLADKVISGLIPRDYVTPFEDLYDQLTGILKNAGDDVAAAIAAFKAKVDATLATLNDLNDLNTAKLQKLASSVDAIQTQIDAGNVVTRVQFEQALNDTNNRLNNRFDTLSAGTPKPVDSLAALTKAYPNGAAGLYFTADDGNLAFWDSSDNSWHKGPSYSSPTVTGYPFGIVSDVGAITINKQTHEITFKDNFTITNERFTSVTPMNNAPKLTYAPVSPGDIILSYNPDSKAFTVTTFDAIPDTNWIILAFQQDTELLIMRSNLATVKVIAQNGLYERQTMAMEIGQDFGNRKIGMLNDPASIVIDLHANQIRFANNFTVSTQNYDYVTSVSNVSSIDIKGLTSYLIYTLVYNTDTKNIQCYLYNAPLPRNSFVLAAFKPTGSIIVNYGPESSVVMYGSDGSQIYPNVTKQVPPYRALPKFYPASNNETNFFNYAYFEGRWTRKTVNGDDVMYSTNLGSQVLFKVHNATKVTVDFKNNGSTGANPQLVAIKQDGVTISRIGVDKMPVTFSVDQSEHFFQIYLAGNNDSDNVWTGNQGFALKGITVDAGTIEPVEIAGRQILYFGDSITAGCWVNGKTASTDYGADENFAALTSKRLAAGDIRIGYSASGLSKGGAGSVPLAAEFLENIDQNTTAPDLFPDIIVINVGTNDGDLTSDAFTKDLSDIVKRMEVKFPGAYLVLMIPFNGTRSSEIYTVAQALGVMLVDTTGWGITTTDGTHPDNQGSQVAAENLSTQLVKLMPAGYFG